MKIIKMMQGDAYRLPFRIRQDGVTLTPEMITDLEVTAGSFRRTFRGGDITYGYGCWYLYLSQEDTLRMTGMVPVMVRIRYQNQPWVTVSGKCAAMLHVDEHPRAEVL